MDCQHITGHLSTLLLNKKSNRNKVFVGGETWSDKSEEELTNIFSEADVIHFHNFAWDQSIFVKYPHLREISKKKKFVIQYHSPRNAHESFEKTLSDPSFDNRRLVLAQYHVRQYPECSWIVPNPLPLHKPPYTNVPVSKWSLRPIVLSYAPSNAHLSGWDYKGYDRIHPILNHCSVKGYDYDLIRDVPYEQCLKRKAWSHVGVEEFFTGSYHLSFLEYLALENCTFGYMDELTEKALASVVGMDAVRALPFIRTTPEAGLLPVLSRPSPELFREKAVGARSWMLTHWSPEKTMKHYDAVYASLL